MITPRDAAGAQREEPEAQIGSAVSVIMPVLNEESYLATSVGAVLHQDFEGSIEIILALGPSTDDTDQVAAQLCAQDSRVRTVANPTGRTPAGLNAALAHATADVVVRVDGHCELPKDYVRVAVETLRRTGADNVGGIMAAHGETPFESAVAVAMTSPLGVGGASFHVGGHEGEAKTVYLGAFRSSALRRVSGYDERFDRAQDWEMNHRIRATGGLVWFNPAMQVSYRPRPTVRALARQYFQYGTWRREIMRQHTGTVQFRYLAPPAAVIAVGTGLVVGVLGIAAGGGSDRRATQMARLGWAAPLGYLAAISAGGWLIGRGQPRDVQRRVPVALATMHVAWGVGFITSRRKLPRTMTDSGRAVG
jgi:succinoglycan biosynthesis protein ExoA